MNRGTKSDLLSLIYSDETREAQVDPTDHKSSMSSQKTRGPLNSGYHNKITAGNRTRVKIFFVSLMNCDQH